MGLISKEVEVMLHGSNPKYFESLNYNIPKVLNKYGKMKIVKGSKIAVRVDDLPPQSNVMVMVQCDECGIIYEKPYYNYTSQNHEGRIYCKECSHRILQSGEQNPAWNPNKTQEEREHERSLPEYKMFIRRVLARDQYVCQCCKSEGKSNLEVHHLDGYNWCKDKRCDDTNGICLCKKCHSNFHTIYGNGNNTKEQFYEWIGNTLELLSCNVEISSTKKVYCIDNNTIYDGANHACRDLHIPNRNMIYDVCNKKALTTHGYHFLWYDEYINMTNQEIEEYIYNCDSAKLRRVICLETKEIFDSAKIAGEKHNNKSVNITRSCRQRSASRGMHWMWLSDYQNEMAG